MPHTASLPDEAAIRDALRQVIDPEVGINIVDLGLIYEIDVRPERCLVEMTMTSPACPLGAMIIDEAIAALTPLLPESCPADVRLVWDPPWDASLMSAASRERFGWSPDQ